MKDLKTDCRLAIVQAAPVMFNKDACLQKALRLIEEAAKNGAEPTVPFRVYDDYRDFRAAGAYDFVTLAISPRYAPKEADGLVEVVGEYIRGM